MQRIDRDRLASAAKRLLAEKKVDCVLGYRAGEFDYDVAPFVFTDAEQIDEYFVFSDFCGANLSKYLIKETQTGRKAAVFLKPCDTYGLNLLLTEHRVKRENVYAIGVQCSGMADIRKIKNTAGDGVTKIIEEEDGYTVYTLYNDGPVKIKSGDALTERCLCCQKSCVICDEQIGEPEKKGAADRFGEVRRIEEMTADQRYEFWRGEFSRCIRCNACRDACPACTCEKCVFDDPKSGVENKSPANEFEEKLFHIIRAFHVAGRCTDCGECSRVCPQQIPLHLLNRKYIKDINTFYGEYQSGESVGQRAPLVNYTAEDREP
ncbi:MAG: 4Fe-4S dicluster domain-containing protein [Clostridia bacterium]|nr:4Fe-4S dicluster domain-containing protein [Clostridia bacterium]